MRPRFRPCVRASASSSARLLHAFSSASVHVRLRPCLCACVRACARAAASGGIRTHDTLFSRPSALPLSCLEMAGLKSTNTTQYKAKQSVSTTWDIYTQYEGVDWGNETTTDARHVDVCMYVGA